MDEELLQRQAPQALEAEQSVLGSMLIDERCVPDVVGMLQPDDFYLRQNREIYETIYTMFNFSEKIDPVTVLNKMKERGVYDEQRSYDYIAQLLKITPTAANVKQYCTIVHDKSLLRALATASSEITEMVYDGIGTAQEMLEVSEKKIYSLRRGNTGDSLQHIGKVMINVYDRLEELAASGSEIPGLSTGLHDLDRKINGLNKTDLILIAARPGMGKTAIALNICLNVRRPMKRLSRSFRSKCRANSWSCVFFPRKALLKTRSLRPVIWMRKTGESSLSPRPRSARRISAWTITRLSRSRRAMQNAAGSTIWGWC